MTTPNRPTPTKPPVVPPAPTPPVPAPVVEELSLDTILRLEKEAQALSDRAAQARARLNTLSPNQKDAEALHAAVCNFNHDDRCSWYYETWAAPGSTRHRYLTKVDIIKRDTGLTVSEAIRIYQIVR